MSLPQSVRSLSHSLLFIRLLLLLLLATVYTQHFTNNEFIIVWFVCAHSVHVVVPLSRRRAREQEFASTGAIMKVRYSQTGWRFEKHSKAEWNCSSGAEWPGWPGEIQALIVLRAAFAWTTFQRSAVFARNSIKTNSTIKIRARDTQERFLTVSVGIDCRAFVTVCVSVCVCMRVCEWAARYESNWPHCVSISVSGCIRYNRYLCLGCATLVTVIVLYPNKINKINKYKITINNKENWKERFLDMLIEPTLNRDLGSLTVANSGLSAAHWKMEPHPQRITSLAPHASSGKCPKVPMWSLADGKARLGDFKKIYTNLQKINPKLGQRCNMSFDSKSGMFEF